MISNQECISLWDEYDMPENIRQHTLLVAKIAVFLGTELKKKGEDIDLTLLEAAAMLHDLDKIQTIGDNVFKHGDITAEILEKKGLSKLGKIIQQHPLERPFEDRWDIKLLRYADSRTKGEKIVSVKQRMEYLMQRYPHFTKERSDAIKPMVLKIEKQIFSRLDFRPDELEKILINKQE